MDRLALTEKLARTFGKYKYVLLVLLLGIGLMCLPSGAQENETVQPTVQEKMPDPGEELELILSQIDGVGKVSVLLTESAGAQTHYQMNEDRSESGDSGSVSTDTVIITGADRSQQGLVKTVTPPTYLGAIIVCQGGDSAVVRLSIVEAVSAVTGISADRITVLKMK